MMSKINSFKMAQRLVSLSGAAVFFIGALKAVPHMFSASGFVICGSDGASQSAFLSLSSAAHCWGCPVALSGLAMIAAAAILTPPKDINHALALR